MEKKEEQYAKEHTNYLAMIVYELKQSRHQNEKIIKLLEKQKYVTT